MYLFILFLHDNYICMIHCLVDVECSLKTVRQRSETVYAEDWRIDQVATVLEK